MLVELHIRNFALIERIDIELAPGLNVLTGETGAGKSIVVDALQLALGGRASADVVRTGQEQANIVAVFRLPDGAPALTALEKMDLLDEADGGQVILRRDVLTAGRSRARINGHPVTVAQLQEIGERLVDVHGQHDHQSLLRTATQLELLDAYGGPPLLRLRRQFSQAWTTLVRAKRELAELRQDERERARRLDMARFQLDEIDGAALQADEEERLKEEEARLAHLGRLQQETARFYDALAGGVPGEPAAGDVLQEAAHTVAELAQIDEELQDAAGLLEGAALQAREAAAALRSYAEGLDADPQALETVASRLALISDLKRKYGADVAEVLSFADGLRAELDALEKSDDREAQLSRLIDELEGTCRVAATELSAARRDAADRLELAVSAELEGLHMGPGRFRVALDRQAVSDGLEVDGQMWHASASGIDSVQFLLSANPGEPARPLARIASGGELSRVALALKRSLIEVDEVPTLVFDEIDAGIGGETAQAVARRLAAIGRHRQVISVTHLAQIAAIADHHLHVHKADEEDRTVSSVAVLDDETRIEEIARMLAGVLTDKAVDNARELLSLAQKSKFAS